MNIDWMRRIDRWAGVPLCFVLTQVRRIWRPRPDGVPRNILFIELSEMGSAILVDPALRKARSELNAELHFVIFKRNVGSLYFLKTVPGANIFTLRDDSLLALITDTIRFLIWTRKRKIDTVIDLELFSRFTALLSGLSGASRTVGYYRFHNEGLYRGELLTHRVAYNPHIHIAKNFIALINSLLSPAPELPYSKTLVADSEIVLYKPVVDEASKDDMRRVVAEIFSDYEPGNHRIVLMNPNASEMLPHRRWPRENFAALASEVLARWEDVIILVTGAAGENADAEQLIRLVKHPRIVNFAGKCRLQDLLPLYHISELMVTNDSGPGHFSSITNMRSIVLFGPETPALYGSLGNSEAIYAGLTCSPCVSASNHRKTACNDAVCMKAITPARVLQSIVPLLSQAAQRL